MGNVITSDQIEKFEKSLSKNHHHVYESNGVKNSDPLALEYQRVYNKFTPTPLPNPCLLNGNNGLNFALN